MHGGGALGPTHWLSCAVSSIRSEAGDRAPLPASLAGGAEITVDPAGKTCRNIGSRLAESAEVLNTRSTTRFPPETAFPAGSRRRALTHALGITGWYMITRRIAAGRFAMPVARHRGAKRGGQRLRFALSRRPR